MRLREQGGVSVRQKLSDQEFHSLYCPVKNPRSALFLLAFFSVTAFVGWKGLHKAPEPPSFVELFFAIVVVALLARWLVTFTCFRERLVFGSVIVILATEEVESFVPSVFGRYAEIVKSGRLALSLVCLLVSLTMLVQSVRAPGVGPSELKKSVAWQKRSVLIYLVVIAAILVLGTMLYFRPLR
jgi:hypothetical protein